MNQKSIFKKLLAAFLAFAMVFGALASLRGIRMNTVSAESVDYEGVHLDKTAWLEADGTYSIKLEAYATAQTVTVETEQIVPTDFVLVIDQSGSMEDVLTYAGHTYYHYHLKAIKAACKSFIRELNRSGADHRVAIAGFAMENTAGYNYMNTGIFNGSTTNFVKYNQVSSSDYNNAFMSVQTAATDINTCIDKLQANGGTATHIGMELANNILAAHRNDTYDGVNLRNKVVVVFSDGTPGYYGYSPQWAAKAVNLARTAKSTYNAKVLTVALVNNRLNTETHAYYNGNYPNSNEIQATPANTSAFMDALSSNYPNASGNESTGAISAGSRTSSSYYLNVTDSVDMNYASNSTFDNVTRLTDAFLNIPEIVITSSTTTAPGTRLNANSVLRDYMSEYFKLNETDWERLINYHGNEADANDNYRDHHVFVRIHSCTGYRNGEFVFNELHDDAEDFYEDELDIPWYEQFLPYQELPAGISVDFDFYQKSLAVKGFDYAANYCRRVGANGAAGKKIVVLIKGNLAEEGAVGENIPTNKDFSGVYPTPTSTTTEFTFPVPTVNIREHVVVYDFGIRLEDDNALDFFGKSAFEHDVKQILTLDDCYNEQNYHPTMYRDPVTGRFVWADPTIEDMAKYEEWCFEYKTVYPYEGTGYTGWVMPGYDSSRYWEEYKDLFRAEIVQDANGGYHASFEPYTISRTEYTFAALLRLEDDTFEWCRLTFLPATNVLYEERTVEKNLDSEGHTLRTDGFMKFEDGAAAAWEHTDGWQDDYQHAGNNMYGFDSNYTNHDDTHDSHGGAHYVTVNKAMYDAALTNPSYQWPSCEFDFSGTGFDLISRSGKDTGVLVISIVPENEDWTYTGTQKIDPITGMPMVDAQGKAVMSRDYAHVIVDTRYKDGDGTSLYQIPVLHYDYLEYGFYKALVTAIYMPIYDHQNEKGAPVSGIPGIPAVDYEYQSVFPESESAPTRAYGSFTSYIDAVRIYHPRGESIFGKGVDEISYLAANDSHSELNAEYKQLKQLFLGQNPNGDGIVNLYVDEVGTKPVTVEEYANNGPNNEAYIKPGGAFAFKLDGSFAGIHLSAKAPFNSGAITLKVNGQNVASISHATELFYDITEFVGSDGQVAITCEGDANSILSLVQLKLIPEVGEFNTQPAPSIVSDESLVDFTEAVTIGIMGDANHDRQLDIMDALFAMRCSLGSLEPDAYGMICGDMDANNAIDLLDAVSIIRLALEN